MFDIELFRISEKVFENLDKDAIEKRNLELNKKIVEIIKKQCTHSTNTGLKFVSAASDENEEDYIALMSIICLGKQKYYEEELSLYYIGIDSTHLGSKIYFVWNGLEYNIKNDSYAKNFEKCNIKKTIKPKPKMYW